MTSTNWNTRTLKTVVGASLVMAGCLATAGAAEVPETKRTTLGLYMTAVEAAAAVAENPAKVLFLDVRTPAELMFIGASTSIDANVPYVDLKSPPEWDAKNNRLVLVLNADFVVNAERRLRAKALTKADQVIVMCRSGDRSGKAVDALAKAGFSNAWTVVDGFEGDMSKDGRRDVNGWKQAGLPWAYTLEKSKLSLPVVDQ